MTVLPIIPFTLISERDLLFVFIPIRFVVSGSEAVYLAPILTVYPSYLPLHSSPPLLSSVCVFSPHLAIIGVSLPVLPILLLRPFPIFHAHTRNLGPFSPNY